MNDFLKTLFDKDENINICKDKYHIKTQKRDNIRGDYQFFCINPLVDKGTRADKSVSVYRNILIEMDDVSLEDQARVLKSFPHNPTTIVYSGSKSLHAIWSFEFPFDNEQHWRRISSALAKCIEENYDVKVDKSCLNPSRLSRYPNYKRDNGKVQELEFVGERLHGGEMMLMLLPWVYDPGKPLKPKNHLTLIPGGVKYSIGGPVFRLLNEGWDMDDGRKNLVYLAACELNRNGVELDVAIEFLEDKCDIRYDIYLHQVRSGYRYGD